MPRPGPHVALALAAAALAAGCKERKPASSPAPAPIAALRAIPADATAVVGLDLERLARSRLAARAVEQMLDRDPELRGRLDALAAACQLDLPRQVRTVHLALGPPVTGNARASLLVATGELTEASLARCLQAGVGDGGGQVTLRGSGDRTLYRLAAGRREVFFGFGAADTIVLGPREDWVLAGLGDGAKVESSPVLRDALAAVDRTASLWAVATVDPELGEALTRISEGAIAAGPKVVAGTLDPVDGVRATATFTMVGEGDARALAGYARGELAVGTIAARALGLDQALAKVAVEQDGPRVVLRVALTDAEVKDVLAAIDRGQPPGQDAQPAADAGAGPSTPTQGSPGSPAPDPTPPAPGTPRDAGAGDR